MPDGMQGFETIIFVILAYYLKRSKINIISRVRFFIELF